MSNFAEVIDGIVQRVIVAEQEFIDTGALGDPLTWIQCSYNTCGGQHTLGGVPFRKNFPGAGYTYDSIRDAFIPPKPFPSWSLNEETCLWEAPTPEPNVIPKLKWDELTQTWIDT
jgi:hypothetical protein